MVESLLTRWLKQHLFYGTSAILFKKIRHNSSLPIRTKSLNMKKGPKASYNKPDPDRSESFKSLRNIPVKNKCQRLNNQINTVTQQSLPERIREEFRLWNVKWDNHKMTMRIKGDAVSTALGASTNRAAMWHSSLLP